MSASHFRDAFQHIFNMLVRLQRVLLLMMSGASRLASVAKNRLARVLHNGGLDLFSEAAWLPPLVHQIHNGEDAVSHILLCARSHLERVPRGNVFIDVSSGFISIQPVHGSNPPMCNPHHLHPRLPHRRHRHKDVWLWVKCVSSGDLSLLQCYEHG